MPHLVIAASLVLLQAPAPDVPPPTSPAEPAPALTEPEPAAPAPADEQVPPPPAQPHAEPSAPAQPYAQPYPQPYPQPYEQPGAPPSTPYPLSPGVDAPVPTRMAEGPGALPESVTHRKLVFANFYTLNFSVLMPIPSGDFTFFIGTNLRPRKNRARTFDWNTALGYQLTLSAGPADMPTFIFSLSQRDSIFSGLFVHRHHLTAMGYGGQRQRLFYSFGAGAFFDAAELAGIEGEGRLAYVFSQPDRRIKGVVGGQARLTSAFGVPLLQLGPFIGFMAF
jgi:hypothetical protein